MLKRRTDEDLPLLLGPDRTRVRPIENAPELDEAVLDRGARQAVAVLGQELVQGSGGLALGVLDAVRFVDDDDGEVAGGESGTVVAAGFDADEDCGGWRQWEYWRRNESDAPTSLGTKSQRRLDRDRKSVV